MQFEAECSKDEEMYWSYIDENFGHSNEEMR
ncbi:MAG: hypothetical protein UU11_C0003G0044 [Parcubacteria group bacterium GW2011_GWF2_40_69]|nr:MAG: hypothetical protein UT68_C0006G0044 [Parcubacteria group bacterium GW2011_GWC2_40_10]KKR69050.1 MAG: hypothetical protein UU11_C0003G0044 [Parcubacteria group bacterium GW2011_GWF2_40_69]KKR81632.1 MAG: hypothetical protein UU27_C0012G0007 [Parcubacteria group bacterium GW2011_GWD1_40_9]